MSEKFNNQEPGHNNIQWLPKDWSASFTVLTYTKRIGKRYFCENDKAHSVIGSNGFEGHFATRTIASMAELSAMQETLSVHQCLIAGTSTVDDAYGKLGYWRDRCHERTKAWFTEPFDCAVVTIDIDREGAPAAIQERLTTSEGVAELLVEVVPEMRSAALLVRPSSSNGVLLPNGDPVKPGGWHGHLISPPGQRVEVLHRLYAAFARAGLAWILISSVPSLLKRNIVDSALFVPNQPIFSAAPDVSAPLVLARPVSFAQEGCSFDPEWLPDEGPKDVKHIYDSLRQTPVVQAALNEAIITKAEASAPRNSPERTQAVLEQIVKLRRQAVDFERGSLGPNFRIKLESGATVTVAEVLENRDRYHLAKTLTPGEEEYRDGAQTGIIYTDQPKAVLHTQAHGGTTYALLPCVPESLLAKIAPKPAPVLTPPEATARLNAELDLWLSGSRRMAIRATMGLGKTRAVVKRLAHDKTWSFLYLVPTTELAVQAFDAYGEEGGADATVWRGRSAKDPDSPDLQMCLDLNRVERALAHQKTGQENIFRVACIGCSSADRCGYMKQRRRLETEPPRVMFATHDFAHLSFPTGWVPGAVVIDEALRTGGIDMGMASPNIPLDAMFSPGATKQRLDEHKRSMPDQPFGAAEVKRHRLRGEVLEALAEGHRYYCYKGQVVVPRVRPYIYPDTPLLLLDGTFRPELAELYFGGFDRVVEINAQRNVEIIHICGTAATKYSMNKDMAFNCYMKTAVDRALENGWMVASYKSVMYAWGLEDHPRCVWFGNTRGVDHLKDCPGGLVIGRNYPPVHILENIAQVLGDHHGFEVTHVGHRPEAEVAIRGHLVKVPTHMDPIVRALLESAREDELMQAVDRLRLVWHEGPPKPLVIVNEIPVPDMTPHSVVEWKNFKNGRLWDRLTHAILTGVIPNSPHQAVRLRPEVWSSRTTAERDYAALTAKYPKWRDTVVESEFKPVNGRRKFKILNLPVGYSGATEYQDKLCRLGMGN
jgi:hypothetical protein